MFSALATAAAGPDSQLRGKEGRQQRTSHALCPRPREVADTTTMQLPPPTEGMVKRVREHLPTVAVTAAAAVAGDGSNCGSGDGCRSRGLPMSLVGPMTMMVMTAVATDYLLDSNQLLPVYVCSLVLT